jgi:hypothetical protein
MPTKKEAELEKKIDTLEWALAMEMFPKTYLEQPACQRILKKQKEQREALILPPDLRAIKQRLKKTFFG